MNYENYLCELKNSLYLLYYGDIITQKEFIEFIGRWRDKNDKYLIKDGELAIRLNSEEE